MASVSNIVFYILTFLSVYVQVFFLITFLENRKRIMVREGHIELSKYPKVTIIVPCWNEEKTVYKTVRSLLDLNYPKDKVNIFLIDDGSTDKTLDVISRFSKFSNVKVFHKENGGKYTALNLGLEHLDTEFIGCLDADSMADRESLVRIMSYFEKDQDTMAVSPSVLTINNNSFVQSAQKADYDMSVYIKKMLGFLGAIHVTPGPLTIFRKKVFDDLGPYHHAHNTEDLEIAYRMQKNHYKIEQCNDAYVYTNTPKTIKKLYRQRSRWVYGFINNTIDYRKIIFKRRYGNFSLFTVPFNILSILGVGFLFGKTIYTFVNSVFQKVLEIETMGFSFFSKVNFDSFFINTQAVSLMALVLILLTILSIIIGRKMSEGKWGFSFDIFFFLFIFGIVGPFWFLKAVYNTIISRKPAWR
ncbi:MAG: glycosyltransferase family 2 protein [Candidatus Paceibacterota bacterium]